MMQAAIGFKYNNVKIKIVTYKTGSFALSISALAWLLQLWFISPHLNRWSEKGIMRIRPTALIDDGWRNAG